MNASAWFMIAVFALFAVALTIAAIMGARRDREVEEDVQREARRRLHRSHRRRNGSGDSDRASGAGA